MKTRIPILAALAALMLVPAAGATPPDLPALGYQVSLIINTSTQCKGYHVTGFGADVTFDQAPLSNGSCIADYGVDAQEAAMRVFAAGHDERKLGFEHTDAVTARAAVQAKGYTVATSYVGPSFTVTGGCQGSSTLDVAGLVSAAAGLPAASEPCPPPVVAPPAEPPPPATDPAVLERLAALEAKVVSLQAAIEASWNALVAAYEAGQPPWEAALAARSAAMNALYGLG